ncbi:hypothetical protein NJI34_37780 [Pseudomonas sp. S 311-6]|nr:hypothetical protein [Pseudomonas sp. S 311-6]
MALDDMYASGINAAVQNLGQLEPVTPTPDPGFNWWGLTTAAPRGSLVGAAESVAFGSEILNAFGTTYAAYASAANVPFVESEEAKAWRQQGAAAAKERLDSGEAYSTETGDAIRGWAKGFMPDAQTSGFFEQSLFDISRIFTKAVGYSVAGGIGTGVVMTGLDEGLTASDELRKEGVDIATRTKVGALTGVATGVSVAVPVAGVGWKSTAGLVAAGGPGLFMAQTALTRNILDAADYSELSDRYDPFDPVGLAVSTLLPAAFGGWALRSRSRRAAAAGETPPAPQSDGDNPVRPLPYDHEIVDAARVQAAKEVVDSWNLADPTNIRAAQDSLLSVMRASDQLASGMPVSVLDAIPMERSIIARGIDRMIERAESQRADLLAESSSAADPGVVRATREELRRVESSRVDASDEAVRARAKEIQAAESRTSYKQALSRARQEFAQRQADTDATIARLEQQIEDNANADAARQALSALDRQIEQMKADRDTSDAPAIRPGAQAVREAFPVRQADAGTPARIPETMAAPAAAARTPGAPRSEAPTSAAAGEEISTGSAPGAAANSRAGAPSETGEPIAGMGGGGVPDTAAIESRIARLASEAPDRPIRLEGMEEDLTLAEALERIEAAARQEIADADLIQVAATCALGA